MSAGPNIGFRIPPMCLTESRPGQMEDCGLQSHCITELGVSARAVFSQSTRCPPLMAERMVLIPLRLVQMALYGSLSAWESVGLLLAGSSRSLVGCGSHTGH
jgi:hypothetical protein